MEQKEINKNCPVSTTLKLIGGKYKALIIWHLTDRTLRFNELRKLIPEATPKMLTQQLRKLEADKLIRRTVYPIVPPKVEYILSSRGKSLFPILESMYAWGAEEMKKEGLCPHCTMMGRETSKI
ncbi:MAG: winged helix-turn-helix transcriptional regulator [Selenomonadaceae bacterium]